MQLYISWWSFLYLVVFIQLVNIHLKGIRLCTRGMPFAGQKTPCLLQRCGLSLVSSAPKKWRLTHWLIDLFKKEPLTGNSKVHLHTPSKFGEDPWKDLGGVGEQTDKRCSNYSMIVVHHCLWIACTITSLQLIIFMWCDSRSSHFQNKNGSTDKKNSTWKNLDDLAVLCFAGYFSDFVPMFFIKDSKVLEQDNLKQML